MLLFLDSADAQEIKYWQEQGFIDGVTTNPSLIAKSQKKIHTAIKEICDLFPDSTNTYISAEVVATEFAAMMEEAYQLHQIAASVVIKLPLTLDGLRASKALRAEGIETNVTLCFSVNQAILAAKADATFVSPFIGRNDTLGIDGSQLITNIHQAYEMMGTSTMILAASVQNPWHFNQAIMAGADAITVSPTLMKQLYAHPLTDSGLAKFLADYNAARQ